MRLCEFPKCGRGKSRCLCEGSPPDAEAVARETLRQTLRSYVRIERGPEGSHPKTDRDIQHDDAANEQEIAALVGAVERRVRAAIAAEVESAECVERLASVVDDINPRITHQGDREDAAVYCRYIAKRIRAAQDHTGGGDG